MPLYYFHCTKCDSRFEEFLPLEERDMPVEQVCPTCKESGVERIIGDILSIWKTSKSTNS